MKNKLGLYSKLALSSMWKSARFYVPYIFTCVLSVAMYYNIYNILKNPTLPGGSSFKMMMSFGTAVVAVFCTIFLFYTNSFLIKRRKNEFGLYNILGMEKRHIIGMISIETLVSAFCGIAGGLLVGIVFSRLLYLIVNKYFVATESFSYAFGATAITGTIILFGIVYGLILLKNILEVSRVKPIELLKAEHSGEKEPKAKWFWAFIGLLCTGAGYYMSITTQTPMQAVTRSITAVLLVIAGTYFLFVTGSIVFLKSLKKNRNYYYRSAHFVSVSGMLYRMKQNAVGLANICILSTMVMVMLSTTASLYIGGEDIIKMRYPTSFSYGFYGISRDFDKEKVEKLIEEKVREAGLSMQNVSKYDYASMVAQMDSEGRLTSRPFTFGDRTCVVSLIEAKEYENLTADKLPAIAPGTLGVMTNGIKLSGELSFMGKSFPVTQIKSTHLTGELSVIASDSFLIVVPDEDTYYELIEIQQNEENADTLFEPSFQYSFDTDGTEEQNKQLFMAGITTDGLRSVVPEEGIRIIPSLRELEKAEFSEFTSAFLFLGIFLGILFVMATVLIIYYKQMIEGYEDKDKYEIMQKVGMDKSEVQKAIRQQVKTMFFLPLGVAICHTFGAFPLLMQCLHVFNLFNTQLYIAATFVTILLYTAAYAVVYAITTKVYYKIVTAR